MAYQERLNELNRSISSEKLKLSDEIRQEQKRKRKQQQQELEQRLQKEKEDREFKAQADAFEQQMIEQQRRVEEADRQKKLRKAQIRQERERANSTIEELQRQREAQEYDANVSRIRRNSLQDLRNLNLQREIDETENKEREDRVRRMSESFDKVVDLVKNLGTNTYGSAPVSPAPQPSVPSGPVYERPLAQALYELAQEDLDDQHRRMQEREEHIIKLENTIAKQDEALKKMNKSFDDANIVNRDDSKENDQPPQSKSINNMQDLIDASNAMVNDDEDAGIPGFRGMGRRRPQAQPQQKSHERFQLNDNPDDALVSAFAGIDPKEPPPMAFTYDENAPVGTLEFGDVVNRPPALEEEEKKITLNDPIPPETPQQNAPVNVSANIQEVDQKDIEVVANENNEARLTAFDTIFPSMNQVQFFDSDYDRRFGQRTNRFNVSYATQIALVINAIKSESVSHEQLLRSILESSTLSELALWTQVTQTMGRLGGLSDNGRWLQMQLNFKAQQAARLQRDIIARMDALINIKDARARDDFPTRLKHLAKHLTDYHTLTVVFPELYHNQQILLNIKVYRNKIKEMAAQAPQDVQDEIKKWIDTKTNLTRTFVYYVQKLREEMENMDIKKVRNIVQTAYRNTNSAYGSSRIIFAIQETGNQTPMKKLTSTKKNIKVKHHHHASHSIPPPSPTKPRKGSKSKSKSKSKRDKK